MRERTIVRARCRECGELFECWYGEIKRTCPGCHESHAVEIYDAQLDGKRQQTAREAGKIGD